MTDVPMKAVIPCDGSGEPYLVPLTPEELAQAEVDKQHHATQQLGLRQAVSADAERLALVAERAEADPAFAALADLALGGKGL